jgi:PadR family transcriptional regulator AphA
MSRSGVANVILGALHKGPKSGYEIKQLVDTSTRFFWAASYGQIYPELRNLERDGLISGTEERVGGRRRIVYALTDAGREQLRRWLRERDAGCELRDLGLLKLFFADALDKQEALEVVRAFKDARQAVLDRLRAIEAGVDKADGGFPLVVLGYGLELHEWVVGWASNLEQQLTSETNTEVVPS